MRVTQYTYVVLEDIRNERNRQYDKFGDDNPLLRGPDTARLACLGEEYGEASREVVEGQLFGHDTDAEVYRELVQVAAVACAWAETMRRDGRV